MSSSKRQKILVVEDNEDQRHMLYTALTGAGYDVVTAAAGSQALAYVERTGPGPATIDLILLDVMLADHVDGFEALRCLKAREETASIPVMIVSAYLDNERIDALLEADAEL